MPAKTPDLQAFYPTSLLVTGFDIIFFWAARMIMFGMEMMGDVPFRQIHIHGLVRDAERQKMSKTKGNTIDPLIVNDQYGTDAVRFALLNSVAPGGDIAFSEEKLTAARNFANKIWNASRLLFTKPREGTGEPSSLADRWIGHRLNACAQTVNAAFENHRYDQAADTLWHFLWDDFCDWYLELKKLESDWSFAYLVYSNALRLLHPLMPFITEELWHRLGHEDSIALAAYPRFSNDAVNAEAEAQIRLLQTMVVDIRQIRADNKVENTKTLEAAVSMRGGANIVAGIESLAKVKLTVTEGDPSPVKLDIPVDRARLEKQNEELAKQIANLDRQFTSEVFMSKAPEKVIVGMRAKKAEYEAQIAKNRAAL